MTVFVDGFACQEYILECSSTSDPNTLECFIPVTAGDQLTISGHFNGTVLHGSLDLLVDGSFLADKRIEGLKSGNVKYTKRKFEFEKVFDMPIPENHTSIFPPNHMIEGNLHVKSLDKAMARVFGDDFGVGSLAIIISVNQKTGDNHTDKHADITCGEWRNRFVEEAKDGGVAPTHELEVKDLGEAVHKNRNSKHRRHFEGTRFGKKPWAKCIFYYRHHMAIKQAGCVLAPKTSHALESGNVKTSNQASTEPRAKGKKQAKVVEEEDDDDDDEIRVASRKSLSAQSSNIFVTPEPAGMKKKLFGQPLFELQSSNNFSGGAAGAQPASTEKQTKADDNNLAGIGDADYQAGSTQDDKQQRDNSTPAFLGVLSGVEGAQLQDMGDESLAAGATEANNLLYGGQTDGPAVPATQMVPPSTTTETEQVVQEGTAAVGQPEDSNQEDEPYIKEEEFEDSSGIFTFDDASKVANAEASLGEHVSHQHHEDMNTSSTKQLAGMGDETSPSTNIPSASTAPQPPKSNLDGPNDHNKAENVLQATTNSTNIKFTYQNMPADSPTTQDNPSPTSTTSPTQNPPTPASMQASFPKKRTASNTSLSRESTPNKKFRSAEMSAKKAALLAQWEQKKQRNAAVKQEMEKQNAVREEEERKRDEADMREIEWLERMNAEEDLELEELVRAKEATEVELEEIRVARERAEGGIGG